MDALVLATGTNTQPILEFTINQLYSLQLTHI